MKHSATVTKSGQIGIPAALLKKLNVNKGDKIDMYEVNGVLMLVRKNSDLDLAIDREEGNAVYSVQAMEDMLRSR